MNLERVIRRSPWTAAIVAAVLLVVALAGLALTAIRVSEQRRHAAEVREHTHIVLETTAAVNWRMTDMQRAQRGYLLTGDPVFLEPYRLQARALPAQLLRLRQLTLDNPDQTARIDRLRIAVGQLMIELDETVKEAAAGDSGTAVGRVRRLEGERDMNLARAELATVYAEEVRLLERRNEAWGTTVRTSERVSRLLALLAMLTGIATVWLIVMAARLAERNRQQAIETEALAISRRELEAAVAARTTELAAANTALQAEIDRARAAEAQVRQLQKLESIGQLTGGIAHDFNNMLAIVLGSLEIAKRRLDAGDSEKVFRHIDNAMEGGQRAAALTQRLLAFARQQPLDPRPVDANKLVNGMSELLRRTLGEGVAVETVLAGGLWPTFADATQLEQAIINLSVNARDAMPDGGKLTIETANAYLDETYAEHHPGAVPGQYVAVCVTDSGTGMTPDVIERAFDPFFTTKGVGQGTGLGLSQVFGFVKQSGGSVGIYSEVGHGTTVKMYLPRWLGAEQAHNPDPPAPAEMPRARDGEAVLVVEDEETIRLMSTEMLRGLGYQVVAAADGEAALTLIEAEARIDLLFTDIVMPGIHGKALADRATALRPGLKVLFTTGYTRNAVVHNGRVDPGVTLLTKPFTTAQLAARVRQVLDGAPAQPAPASS
jgi:signal transduction histidine kinase